VKTGDIGRLDENGNILDRTDDVQHLSGRTGERDGSETPCAVACVKPEASVTEKELVERCSVHLGNDKRPGKVVPRHDPLPKTPVSKIKRKEPREPFRVGRERRVAGH
jgi:acyl-CoA synthetase (AMP-forming)/AMP-acid ligase II